MFTLARDINPVIKQGMQVVIPEVWQPGMNELKLVKEDGSNYEYNNSYTFTLNQNDIKF